MSDDAKRQASALLAPYETIRPHLRIVVPAVFVGTATVVAITLGPPSAVLVLTGGALLGVIALFWGSVRTLFGETPLSGADAYALGAPKQEEERKQAMLRALKDLEFERSVGKISEEDFQVLNQRYREEAKRLLRLLDDEAVPRRKRAEELVEQYLRAEARGEKKPSARERSLRRAKATAPSTAARDASNRTDCAACGVHNDSDATFCKKCGERLDLALGGARKKPRKTAKRKGRS